MLRAIAEARHYVFIEMYLFESGAMAAGFIDELAKAGARGVRIYVLLDDFGARALTQPDRQRLAGIGVEIRFYNPVRYGKWYRNLHRDHRKLLLVDGNVAICGGAGITDSFISRNEGGQDWHDVMVQVEGPCVADWHSLFAQTWRHEFGQAIDLPPPGAAPPQTAAQWGRVTEMTPRDGEREILRSAIKRIGGAEQRVWIATAYFVPSLKLRRVLRRAARRGVDVRLLLPSAVTDHPGVHQAGRHFYSRLLRNKVGVYEYQGRFAHTKIILCDSWCSIGSSNLDRWNVRWNLEANQEIDNSSFAARVADLFEQDFGGSQQFDYEWWKQRPWHWRWREWFWSRIGRWLLQVGPRLGR
jgi:phosphatidylserine/phosphatidylglycerophosphate/cardiolipin synthase-like enzyme